MERGGEEGILQNPVLVGVRVSKPICEPKFVTHSSVLSQWMNALFYMYRKYVILLSECKLCKEKIVCIKKFNFVILKLWCALRSPEFIVCYFYSDACKCICVGLFIIVKKKVLKFYVYIVCHRRTNPVNFSECRFFFNRSAKNVFYITVYEMKLLNAL